MSAFRDKHQDVLAGLDPDRDEFRDMMTLATGTAAEKDELLRRKRVEIGGDVRYRFNYEKRDIFPGDDPEEVAAHNRALEQKHGPRQVVGLTDIEGGQPWPTPEMIERQQERVAGKIGEMAEQEPAVGIGTRAARSVKFAESAKREAVEALEGGIVTETPQGEVLVTPEGGTQFVDKPPTTASFIQMASPALGPLMPLGMAAAELLEPGTTVETAKDIADFAGEALEVAPEVITEVLARRAGGLRPSVGQTAGRTAGHSGAAFAGTHLRRAVSAFIPGQDISPAETATAGVGMALTSGAAEATTALAAVPGRFAHKLAGKQLIGTDNPAARKAIEGIADEMGITLTPGLGNLSDDAILMQTLLMRSPGTADLWQKWRVGNVMAGSRFVDKWADASFGMKVSGEAAAERALKGFRKWHNEADATRKGMFGDAMKTANEATGGRPVLEYGNLLSKLDELEDVGYNVGHVRGRLDDFKDLEGRHRMTVEQMRRKLAEYGEGRIPNLSSETTSSDWAQMQIKQALEEDLSLAAEHGIAGQALKDARTAYHAMSVPIETAKTRLVKKALKLEVDQGLEFLPRDIASGKYSANELASLRTILEETDPVAHKELMRSVWDKVAGEGLETGGRVLGGQVKQEAKLAGQQAFNPAAISKRIKKSKKMLAALSGEDLSKLDDIADGFDRLAFVNEKLSQSPTAPLTGADRLLKAAANTLMLNPGALKQIIPELALMRFRRRMTAILTDPKGRDVMKELLNPPVDATVRTVSTSLQQLGAIVARDSAMFGEEEEEETP